MKNNTAVILSVVIIIAGILSAIGIGCFAYYKNQEIKIQNFENTIKDLSSEEKCLHICGFRWVGASYFDNYKYCVEKCDRISERERGYPNG